MAHPHRVARHLETAAIFSSGCALLFILSRFTAFVEGLYVPILGPLIGRSLAMASGVFPFCLAEWVLFLFIIWEAASAGVAVHHIRRDGVAFRRWSAALVGRTLRDAAVVAFLFYLIWGLHYARKPLIDRLAWRPIEKATPAERMAASIERLASEFVDESNALSIELDEHPENGPDASHLNRLDRRLEAAYRRVSHALHMPSAFAVARGRAKPVLASALMSRLGLSGFYFPFTGEACVNREPPLWRRPHTMAHEKAHQRGITSEAEANFIGFLVCREADSPWARYAAALFAQRQLLSNLDAKTARRLASHRTARVTADLAASRRFWASRRSWLTTLSARINNTYLLTNGVEGGIASYGASVRLILLWDAAGRLH